MFHVRELLIQLAQHAFQRRNPLLGRRVDSWNRVLNEGLASHYGVSINVLDGFVYVRRRDTLRVTGVAKEIVL